MARFPYSALGSKSGSLMPRLPLEISIDSYSVELFGIVDTGAAVNVLPYHVGMALGAVWDRQDMLGPLSGFQMGVHARALPMVAKIPELTGTLGVPLLFAWSNSDEVPVLLGQTNFLMEFNACFYRKQRYFEVWRV